MKKVIIASKNPVKINSVKEGFKKMFPEKEFIFEGISVPSEVNDQPMTNEETLTGAINRVNNAKNKIDNANFWVGIEGGIEEVDKEMQCFAWIIIKSNEQIGKAKTSMFILPEKITELINQGKELGDASNIVFNETNSKHKSGSVGILTNDLITRTKYYEEAVILALIPFNNKEIY